jgi:hypothetical protein
MKRSDMPVMLGMGLSLIFVYIHFGGFSPGSFSRDYIGWIDCIAVGGNRSDLQVSEHWAMIRQV